MLQARFINATWPLALIPSRGTGGHYQRSGSESCIRVPRGSCCGRLSGIVGEGGVRCGRGYAEENSLYRAPNQTLQPQNQGKEFAPTFLVDNKVNLFKMPDTFSARFSSLTHIIVVFFKGILLSLHKQQSQTSVADLCM